jgi:large subunit ribosomal protein L19
MPKSKNGETREAKKKPASFDPIYSHNTPPAMSHPIIKEITSFQLRTVPSFKVGDGVKVHTKVREGDKERTQLFAGIVIARKGHGIHETFTVRRISYGEGVERVFPVNSPNIEKIEIERESKHVRARLYYLRDLKGKAAMQVKVKRYERPVAAPAA